MKRMLLAAATSSILALAAVPSLALAAHHSTCHRRGHHACTQSHRAKHARVLNFGAPLGSPGTTGSTGTTGTGPTQLSPSTPATPSSGETAGTVASFTGGVLTITLTDGSTVSGKVTEETELHCQPATPPAQGTDPDEQGDESSGGNGEDEFSQGGAPGISSHGNDMSGGGGSGGGEDDEQAQQSCTTAALVPGAVVREAELSVGGAGAVWEKIDLLQ